MHENARDNVVDADNESENEQNRMISNQDNYDELIDCNDQKVEGDEIRGLNPVEDVPIKTGGIATTLALLRGSNELNTEEKVVGRTNDAMTHDHFDGMDAMKMGHQDVKLEYRDGKGRKLTPKEAYRQLCYNFHGFGPGKAKLERRKEKEEVPLSLYFLTFKTYFAAILYIWYSHVWCIPVISDYSNRLIGVFYFFMYAVVSNVM